MNLILFEPFIKNFKASLDTSKLLSVIELILYDITLQNGSQKYWQSIYAAYKFHFYYNSTSSACLIDPHTFYIVF